MKDPKLRRDKFLDDPYMNFFSLQVLKLWFPSDSKHMKDGV